MPTLQKLRARGGCGCSVLHGRASGHPPQACAAPSLPSVLAAGAVVPDGQQALPGAPGY